MLSIKDLVKNYRDPDGHLTPILNIRSFDLAVGQQCVIRGASGGGKTTLLNCVAGILLPDSGKIIFQGRDLCGLSEDGRDRFRAANIGYVFQTFNLLDAFTAIENVKLGMSFSNKSYDTDRAAELLRRVGLADRMHHRPKQLSVGQQQRVSVARALANQPKLLLADEPTANVDPSNQQMIIDLMRGVCEEEKVAMLLVTHANEVSSQFDHVIQFDQLNSILPSATNA